MVREGIEILEGELDIRSKWLEPCEITCVAEHD